MLPSKIFSPDSAPQKVQDVYDVFKNFFGEPYVDLQVDTSDNDSFLIYVWWPKVIVTNEYNKSVTIQDLYAKIKINSEGLIPFEFPSFLLNRATYSIDQFFSDYLHSHIRGIPKNDFQNFLPPCLGGGPIRATITTLKTDYDLVEWMLFCQELSVYVTVESISGGPWRKMETIGSYVIAYNYSNYNFNMSKFYCPPCFTKQMEKDFLQYYLTKGHLSLSFRNGKFVCDMSFYEFILDISNAFISFCNLTFHTKSDKQDLFNGGFFETLLVSNGKFYKANNNYRSQNIDSYKGKYVLTFKGKKIFINIIESPHNELSQVIVVNNCFAMDILKNILKVINFRYKNEHNSINRVQDSSQTCQRTIYI